MIADPASADPADPFDRAARRRQRARARAGDDFIARALAAELAERVAAADRGFAVALDIGGSGVRGSDLTVVLDGAAGASVAPPGPVGPDAGGAEDSGRSAARDAAAAIVRVAADEDRLPLADASVDVVAALELHGVGDLPGALILCRRVLRPGGLFVAAVIGGATLAEVRADLLAAEVALTGRAAARVMPMLDPAAAPGLLQRAGFADPVAEVDTLTVRYDDLWGLLRDLRGAGAGNILREREPLRRDVLADAAQRFAARAVAGRVAVTVQVVYLTGRGR